MSGTIVFVDHDGDAFNPNSLGALAKASTLGGEVTAFVAGSGLDDGWAAGLGGKVRPAFSSPTTRALRAGFPRRGGVAPNPKPERLTKGLFGPASSPPTFRGGPPPRPGPRS